MDLPAIVINSRHSNLTSTAILTCRVSTDCQQVVISGLGLYRWSMSISCRQSMN